jgi:broad specificity phosphatase PhoE
MPRHLHVVASRPAKLERIRHSDAESINPMLHELESTVAEAAPMSTQLPIIYLARQGQTAWTITGQHTGHTDLPLTEAGERNAYRLGERLTELTFAKVFTSPLLRAVQTCELAGFDAVAEIDPDLVEWDYGEYEGLTTAEVCERRPDWQLFRDGCPGGESPKKVVARADRVVSRLRAVKGHVLLFSSGHFIRVLAARWIGIQPSVSARSFMLSTASLSALSYEHDLSRPVIRLWNDTHHVISDRGPAHGV